MDRELCMYCIHIVTVYEMHSKIIAVLKHMYIWWVCGSWSYFHTKNNSTLLRCSILSCWLCVGAARCPRGLVPARWGPWEHSSRRGGHCQVTNQGCGKVPQRICTGMPGTSWTFSDEEGIARYSNEPKGAFSARLPPRDAVSVSDW